MLITLYIDAFQANNPLGSSNAHHKIVGVYWSACTTLEAGSKRSTINTLALLNQRDIDHFKMDVCLKKVIDQLRNLVNNGIYDEISKEQIAVRLICCLGNDYSSYGLGEAAYCPSSQLVPIFHLLLNGVPKLAAVFKLLKTMASFKNGLSQL